jgi:hypothetical protein
MSSRLLRSAACGFAAASLALAQPVAAAVDCSTIDKPVVVAGSSAIKPLLAEIAKVLSVPQSATESSSDGPTTILYAGVGSCVGVEAILNGTPLTATTLTYWDSSGAEQSCMLTSSSLVADVGVSDVFASTCTSLPGGLPSNVQDFLGPVQTMTFVVPHASTQETISAEAAYYVFGFGAESGVEPWTDESVIFTRNEQSGTQRMIAQAIGVDASLFRGVVTASSSDLRQQLVGSGQSDAEGAIGILSADEADANRATLNVLAYQDYGRDCAVYPDRDGGSNEKENVRSGDYAIWGPMHLFTTVDAKQHPVNESAGDLIGYITGARTPPVELDLIYLQAQRHVVPQCAMRVLRSTEMGPVTVNHPTQPCGCYYEKASNGTTSCEECSSARDCSVMGSTCSYGYCEAP